MGNIQALSFPLHNEIRAPGPCVFAASSTCCRPCRGWGLLASVPVGKGGCTPPAEGKCLPGGCFAQGPANTSTCFAKSSPPDTGPSTRAAHACPSQTSVLPCKCCVGFPRPTVSSPPCTRSPARSAPAVPGSCFRPQGSMGESVVTLRVDVKREASLEEPSSLGRAVNNCATEERVKPFGGQRTQCSPLLKELIISFGFTFEGSGMPCKNTGRV